MAGNKFRHSGTVTLFSFGIINVKKERFNDDSLGFNINHVFRIVRNRMSQLQPTSPSPQFIEARLIVWKRSIKVTFNSNIHIQLPI
jgi:hypothetical protein